MNTHREWLRIIGVIGAVAVVAGAFGAHALSASVSADRLETWATAVRYMMWHDLALLAVVLSREDLHPWRWILRAWTAGCVVFSGSLFALVLTEQTWLGAVTPAGGILFVCGWVVMFPSYRPPKKHTSPKKKKDTSSIETLL